MIAGDGDDAAGEIEQDDLPGGRRHLAAAGKLLLVPLLFVGGGVAWGFRGMELGILLLMSSAPTAAASYVMVRAMGGNAALAANIIALTTLGSLFTVV